MAPAFVLGAPWRLGPEIVAAYDDVGARLRFAAGQAWRVVRAPMRIGPMAARLRLLASVRTADWCALVEAPTLVITGEPRLDRVVPVAGTREYASAIRGARSAVLPRTGHIGSVTRPEEFAEAVWRFVSSCRRGQDAEGAGS
jgi:pimeloyl-ACP methyl ester carboxylesterase